MATKRDQRKKYTAASEETRKLTPAKISKLSEQEAKRAYNELRSIANRRIAALQNQGYEIPAVMPFTDAISKMPPGVDVYSELPELVHFIKKGPSVTKHRKIAKEAMLRTAAWLSRQAKAEGVPLSQRQAEAKAKAMGRFFNAMYEEFGDKTHSIGSPVIMDMWEDLNSIGINMTEFTRSKKRIQEAYELWGDNQYEFRRIARGDIEDKNVTTIEDLKTLENLKSELKAIATPQKKKRKPKIVRKTQKAARQIKRTVKKAKRKVKQIKKEAAKAKKAAAKKKS